MCLYSQHMKTEILNKHYNASFNDASNMMAKYKITLKKEVFLRFFHILKLAGMCMMKINNEETLEMEYQLEKSPYISVILETRAIAFWVNKLSSF